MMVCGASSAAVVLSYLRSLLGAGGFGSRVSFVVGKGVWSVFHRTKSSPEEIARRGFKPGPGDYYGMGLYATFDLKSQLEERMKMYGDTIIKFYVRPLNFLILDSDVMREQYGFDDIERQVRILLARHPKLLRVVLGVVKDHYPFGRYTSNVAFDLKNVRGLYNVIGGMEFTGERDGRVVVVYDSSLAVPVSYSRDDGKTWFSLRGHYKSRGIKDDVDHPQDVRFDEYFFNDPRSEENLLKIDNMIEYGLTIPENHYYRFMNSYGWYMRKKSEDDLERVLDIIPWDKRQDFIYRNRDKIGEWLKVDPGIYEFLHTQDRSQHYDSFIEGLREHPFKGINYYHRLTDKGVLIKKDPIVAKAMQQDPERLISMLSHLSPFDIIQRYVEEFSEGLERDPYAILYVPKNYMKTFIELYGGPFIKAIRNDLKGGSFKGNLLSRIGDDVFFHILRVYKDYLIQEDRDLVFLLLYASPTTQHKLFSMYRREIERAIDQEPALFAKFHNKVPNDILFSIVSDLPHRFVDFIRDDAKTVLNAIPIYKLEHYLEKHHNDIGGVLDKFPYVLKIMPEKWKRFFAGHYEGALVEGLKRYPSTIGNLPKEVIEDILKRHGKHIARGIPNEGLYMLDAVEDKELLYRFVDENSRWVVAALLKNFDQKKHLPQDLLLHVLRKEGDFVARNVWSNPSSINIIPDELLRSFVREHWRDIIEGLIGSGFFEKHTDDIKGDVFEILLEEHGSKLHRDIRNEIKEYLRTMKSTGDKVVDC